MIPLAVTDVAIADELPGAVAWATRRQIVMDTRFIPFRTLRLVLVQRNTNEKFYLQGTFEDCRAYPPQWQWYDESWSSTEGSRLSPKPGHRPSLLRPPCSSIMMARVSYVRRSIDWHTALTKALIRIGAASLNG